MEIHQIVQIPSADGTPSGRWQNTLLSDRSDSDQPVAIGPEFGSEMDAQEWLWLHGPEKARRMKVTINGIERWLRQSESPMTCERIVELAGMNGHLTMTYHVRIGGDTVRQGTLFTGESIELAHGMRISTVGTDNDPI
jgi:hypothetical protein